MLLARILSKIYKENGIILIDATGQKYICGNPNKQNPIILKLLKENLNWKLIIDPEIEFPEAYMRNEIIIENASLKEFLMQLIRNLGQGEVSSASLISKKIFQFCRYLSNFNLPGKSRKNVEHHYDIGGERGEKLYDIFLDKTHRLYSCAYWKDDTKTLEDAQQNKIDHIAKKLDIQKGQKILEVGCGWGGMVFEIAKKHDCEITGISLSKNQINYCRNKAKKLGLDNQVKFELLDYRKVCGQFDRIFSTNVYGLTMLTQEVVKFFKTQQSGTIINIGSTAANNGFASGSVYCASKFALRGLTACWRQELRKDNIRVTLVNPSEVTTAFNAKDRIERENQQNKLSPKEIAHSIISAIEMDKRGFIPELNVWATNPF